MSVDIEAIRWLLDNSTAYAISKNCGVSIQAVDKYKNGVSDIMNMRLYSSKIKFKPRQLYLAVLKYSLRLTS